MKDFLHDINFTTDFSQSKATALEIAHFLEICFVFSHACFDFSLVFSRNERDQPSSSS